MPNGRASISTRSGARWNRRSLPNSWASRSSRSQPPNVEPALTCCPPRGCRHSHNPKVAETKGDTEMSRPPIVSQQQWEAARQELLVQEKELTRARDALAASRRRMPWVRIDKDYRFEGPDGAVSLLDLFDGRRQLIVYRAFFEPGVDGWPDHACRGCSLIADNVGHVAHLNARN